MIDYSSRSDNPNKSVHCPICHRPGAQQIPHGEVWCEACGWTNARGELIDK